MKQLIFTLLFLILLTSCNKKTVLLPETNNKDITEILDVSPVYLFYDETQPDSTEFNRKNMISTTNWLVNIDKRLTLKQILPHLKYLQDKRHGDGMHTNKNAKNYFTCSNPELQNLAFIEFTDVVYHNESSGDYLSKVSNLSDSRNAISIVFNLNDEITFIDSNSKSFISKINSNHLIQSIKENDSLENIIYLNFHEDLNYQDYITYKSLLLELDLKHSKISNQEFLHN